MTTFTKGDRVELNQYYDGYKSGDTGIVVNVEAPGTVMRGLDVKMDSTGKKIFAFIERWDKAEPKALFEVGNWVEVTGRKDHYNGIVGQITKSFHDFGGFCWVIDAAEGQYKGKHLHFYEEHLKAAKEPQRLAFKVGDRVQNKQGEFAYGKHKGKDLVVIKLREEESSYDYTVSIVGSTRQADAADYTESELEAYAPKTAADTAGYKSGDKVRPKIDKYPVTAGFKEKGGTISESQTPSSELIQVLVGGRTEYYLPSEIEIGEVESKFNMGDYVEVVGMSYHEGKKGWVVEPNSHWEGDDYIHITTEKGGKSQYRFDARNLKAAEEPWAPKFKKGDWVEVTEQANSAWFGIGQIAQERTEGLDISLVKFDRADRTQGGFVDAQLIPAEEPKPKPFTVGDRVEIVQFATPADPDYNKYKGELGTIVENDGSRYIRVRLDKTEYTYGSLFLPAELKHTTVQKPEPEPEVKELTKEDFPVGTRVRTTNWNGNKSHSAVGREGVVTGHGPYVNSKGDDGGMMYNHPNELEVVAAPDPKLWTEEAKVGQAAYTKLSNGKIDRVLHKISEDQWKITYPSWAESETKAAVVSYSNKDTHTIADNYVLV